MSDTAVLFIFWKRTEKALESFSRIKELKPKRLYLACDGYNQEDIELEERVGRTRREIEAEIDWPCEVLKRYSERNLGCGKGVSTAIDWFFSWEEMGIVIEDDCVVSQEFFTFASELLSKYRDDLRVWTICADNRQGGILRGDGDYYLSIYSHCWGWATWRDRWKHFDYSRNTFDTLEREWNGLKDTFSSGAEVRYWERVYYNLFEKGVPDTWDYQWLLTIWVNGGLNAIPNKRLVKNIGFDKDSTNLYGYAGQIETSEECSNAVSVGTIRHPTLISACRSADQFTAQNVFGIGATVGIALVRRKWKGALRLLATLFR